jgi:integrase
VAFRSQNGRRNQPKEERRIPPHRLRFVGFHTFRHTWATWLRRYGGADVQGLVATGNWRDPRSAARYAHVEPRDEWARVEKLPSIERGQSVETQKTGT